MNTRLCGFPAAAVARAVHSLGVLSGPSDADACFRSGPRPVVRKCSSCGE